MRKPYDSDITREQFASKTVQIYFEDSKQALTNSKSPFMRGEIFGPCLPIIPYRDWEEAPALIDEHPDPLALYLFTRERAKEEDLLRRISFGGGCINDTLIHLSDGRLPFGGVWESGVGRYHGQASFETFSRTTSLVRKSFFPDIPLRYPPFGKVNLPKLLGR
ncbi:MAG: aldehyde dehydrogenase family protein [Peptostreptococcaceae bacterium]|nr:aldehyde dehydrogenase family protein [Peptostreptococcaceae bacterium]